jgi:hypothetical protein
MQSAASAPLPQRNRRVELSYSLPAPLAAADIDPSQTAAREIKSISVATGDAIAITYVPFAIRDMQRYTPIYSTFFELTPDNYNTVSFGHRYHIRDIETVHDTETGRTLSKPVFVKFAPMLNPIREVTEGAARDTAQMSLPRPAWMDQSAVPDDFKDPMNAAYTDNLFCYLSSCMLRDMNFVNGIDYYGSFAGFQEWYRMDITDDVEHLVTSPEFCAQLGGRVFLESAEPELLEAARRGAGSRGGRRPKLRIAPEDVAGAGADVDIELDIEKLGPEVEAAEGGETGAGAGAGPECKLVEGSDGATSAEAEDDESDSDDEGSAETGEGDEGDEEDEGNTETEEGADDDDEDTEYSDEDDDEEDETCMYIRDFPVQMICLEKCEGTLDALFEADALNDAEATAALFQVIASLAAYQKVLHLTHNDLHTNNIMYVSTPLQYLYYTIGATHYRVPTFGRIFKIIDFGRSIFKFGGKVFCNDTFSKTGDARGQYNYPPYFNDAKPRVEPNFSFDLARLGCSLLDLVMTRAERRGDPGKLPAYKRMILEWSQDDNGKSFIYGRDDRERYPGFQLYKMIARHKHNSVPIKDLHRKIFKEYECAPKMVSAARRNNPTAVIDIDRMDNSARGQDAPVSPL